MITGKDRYGLTKFFCIRGSSDVESLHQLINRQLQPWCASLEYMDSVLAIFRHHYNVRASERYRKDFPKTGHYAHYHFDHINDVTGRMFSEPVLEWWSIPAIRPITDETFGFAPCVPLNQQDNVTPADVQNYPQPYKFLALRTKNKVCYLWWISPS